MELRRGCSWLFHQSDNRFGRGLFIALFLLLPNIACQRALPVRDVSVENYIGFEKVQEVPFGGGVKALAFIKEGQYLVVGGCQSTISNSQESCVRGLIHEWSLKEAASRSTVEFPRSVTALAVSQDGTKWVAGDSEGRLIHSTATKEIPKASFHQKGEITSLAFSSDGRWIASGSSDPSYPLGFLDVATGGMVKVKAKFAPVSALTFSPNGRELAIGMIDGALALWEFNVASVPFPISPRSEEAYSIESLVFSPDGHRLAYGRRDGRVVIWDRKLAQSTMEFKGGASATALAFSPDGHYILVGQENGKLLLIESETGQEVWSIRYRLPIQDLAFSPDGTSLAIAVQHRVYVNRVIGGSLKPVSSQQADRLPDLEALRFSKLMSSGRSSPPVPASSSKRLAEVIEICQNEYMWLLPFDNLAGHVIEAMAKTVQGVTVERKGRDQLMITEGRRSITLSLRPLREARGKVGLRQIIRLYNSAQQFMLVSRPDFGRVLEDVAIAAFLADVGPGVRLISEQELRRKVWESDWQRNVLAGAAQAVGHESLFPTALSDRVQYLKLDRFTPATASLVKKWMIEKTSQRPASAAHLLDLRNNQGGDLTSLIETASSLLPEGRIIAWVISRKNGEGTDYISKGLSLPGHKLVVLVNEQTAGTAELLACAIRESGAGIIVGKRTAGVDEMYSTFSLSDGSGVRISTERFYCPGRRSIRWDGQVVDVEVGHDSSKSTVRIGSAKRTSPYHAKQLSLSIPFVNDNQLRVGIEIALCLDQASATSWTNDGEGDLIWDVKDIKAKCQASDN